MLWNVHTPADLRHCLRMLACNRYMEQVLAFLLLDRKAHSPGKHLTKQLWLLAVASSSCYDDAVWPARPRVPAFSCVASAQLSLRDVQAPMMPSPASPATLLKSFTATAARSNQRGIREHTITKSEQSACGRVETMRRSESKCEMQ
eukprot:6173812-Pleurochrysis_carterae.AAC.1